jgi:hypothetical protein
MKPKTFHFLRMRHGGVEKITFYRDRKGEISATGKPHTPTLKELARLASNPQGETLPDR